MAKKKTPPQPEAQPTGPTLKKTHPPKLASVANKLWGMVRDNQNSLDSQRWTRAIQEALAAQEDAYLNAVKYYEFQAKEANKLAAAARKKARQLEVEVTQLEEKVEMLEGRLATSDQQLKNSKAKVKKLQDKYEPKPEEPKEDVPA